jgi:hypothetical protein
VNDLVSIDAGLIVWTLIGIVVWALIGIALFRIATRKRD